VAVLILALGIGANAAVFSVVSTVLLRPLPYKDADHLVWITEFWPRLNNTIVPSPDFLNWREQNQVFESVAAYGGFGELNLSGNAEPERIDGMGGNPIMERSKIHLESPFTYKFSVAFKPKCTPSESRNR
jgi:hypothetical protein